MTILLTFTAFQNIIAEELPQTSEMLLIDWYIGFAYLLQALLALGSCIASLNNDLDNDTIELIDSLFAIILGSLWVLFSLFYVSLRWETFRNFYDQCCCGNVIYNDWEMRGAKEIENWIINDMMVEGYDKDHVSIDTPK